MVAPMVAPDQTSFYASKQSGQCGASVACGCGNGNEVGVVSSLKGFDTSSQSLAGKLESCDVDPSLSDSAQSISEALKEIEENGVSKFETVSVDIEEKKVVDENLVSYRIEKEEIEERESENEVKGVQEANKSIKGMPCVEVKKVDDLVTEDKTIEDKSLFSNEVDDDDKIDQILEEEAIKLRDFIVNSLLMESLHVDKTNLNIQETDDLTTACDGDVELAAKDTLQVAKVEHVGKEESTGVGSSNVASVDVIEDSKSAAESQSNEAREVSEVNNGHEGGSMIPASDIAFTSQFNAQDMELSQGSSGEAVVGVDASESNEETEEVIFGNSKSGEQFLEELKKVSSGIHAHSDETNTPSHHVNMIDGQIVTGSDEEVDTNDDGEEITFGIAALAALLEAATGASSDGGNSTITSQDVVKLFSMEPSAGLGSSLRLNQSEVPLPNRSNIFPSLKVGTGGESESNLSEEEKHKLEKLQSVFVTYLRLVHRLGQSVEVSIAARYLHQLALLTERHSGQSFSLDAAMKMAMEYEAKEQEDLNFSLNILVLGKSGVGKSATINSILGEQKASIHAFEASTTSVREISGTVDGVKITIIDTPGLKSSSMDQSSNAKMLSSVKKVMKKCPPDVVLYVDRLDAQNGVLNNMPLLRTITASLGSSILKNAILTLTHAYSAPPDGLSGTPMNYDVLVKQCSRFVQQSIVQAVGDLQLVYPSLMNPISLVENHPLCKKNQEGVKVLPDGQTWRPQLLLLCYSLKVLSEAKSLLKPQEPLDHRKLLVLRARSMSLPNLLSWMLQSRAHPKLPADQGGNSVDSDIEIDDVSDAEQEDQEDDECDQLPPFKPLRKTQLAKLSKEHKKAYLDEYDYRVKLLQKKQWREELRRMREMKKNRKKVVESEYSYPKEEEAPPASSPVILPDMSLPSSFDSDQSAYRYRSLEPTSQLVTRSVFDTQGWDHDCGLDCVIVEKSLAIAKRFPAAVTVQMTKDKKEFNIHLDSAVCSKHGDNGSTMAKIFIQGSEQLMYVIKGETKFKNLRRNKMTLGGLVTFFGGNIATGVKLEDQIALGKRLDLVGNAGTTWSQGDSACEANLEVRLREADVPIGQNQAVLGLSLTKSKEDLTLTGSLRSQVSIGRQTKVAAIASLDNKRTGRFTVRTSSSDQLQIAIMAIIPLAMSIYKRIIRSGES